MLNKETQDELNKFAADKYVAIQSDSFPSFAEDASSYVLVPTDTDFDSLMAFTARVSRAYSVPDDYANVDFGDKQGVAREFFVNLMICETMVVGHDSEYKLFTDLELQVQMIHLRDSWLQYKGYKDYNAAQAEAKAKGLLVSEYDI